MENKIKEVEIFGMGGNVNFKIGVQSFRLNPIIEETQEDTLRTASWYKDMLKIAFENLGAKVTIHPNNNR